MIRVTGPTTKALRAHEALARAQTLPACGSRDGPPSSRRCRRSHAIRGLGFESNAELRWQRRAGSTAIRSPPRSSEEKSSSSTFGSTRVSTACERSPTCASGISAIATKASSSSASTRPSSASPASARTSPPAAKTLDVTWPIVLDPTFEIWKRYDNSIWPHEYLYNQSGELVESVLGEGAYRRPRPASRPC